jgi:hypothetical protein
MRKVSAIGIVVVFVLAVAVCISHPTIQRRSDAASNTANVNQKLEQKVQFRLKAEAPLDQLIEVAKTFQIPMGIEWSDAAKCKESPTTFRTQETVGELLNAIVRRCHTQTIRVEQGVVHVYSRFVRHPHNILNLRIWRFQLKNGSVFEAEYELGLAIEMELHPARYAGGYNGGYGEPPDDVFSIHNLSFSGRNIRVRDVLDRIIKLNGNALWVARLRTASLNKGVPLSRIYKDQEAIVGIWELFPLKDSR